MYISMRLNDDQLEILSDKETAYRKIGEYARRTVDSVYGAIVDGATGAEVEVKYLGCSAAWAVFQYVQHRNQDSYEGPGKYRDILQKEVDRLSNDTMADQNPFSKAPLLFDSLIETHLAVFSETIDKLSDLFTTVQTNWNSARVTMVEEQGKFTCKFEGKDLGIKNISSSQSMDPEAMRALCFTTDLNSQALDLIKDLRKPYFM
jgi:hypothetical protein